MRTLSVNGANLAVHEQGRGQPILFVHGFPLDHTMWHAQMEAFAKSYRVIAPDLRGFGHSDVTSGTVTMEQFADDLNMLLDALEVREQIVYCGLSMGGYIGWEFLRKYGDRVWAVIMCDTRSAADKPEAAEGRRKTAKDVLEKGSASLLEGMLPKLLAKSSIESQPEVVAKIKKMIEQTDPQGVAAALRGMADRPDSTPRLAGLKLPTVVIGGAADTLTPVPEMRAMAQAIAGTEFIEIAGAGHMSPMEQPAAVNAAMEKFLKSVA